LAKKGTPELATCAITELGFVRVLAQAPQCGLTVVEARQLLGRVKAGTDARFTFISDDRDVSRLPAWVVNAKQTTDGHLAQLALANGAILATFDRKIPGTLSSPSQIGIAENKSGFQGNPRGHRGKRRKPQASYPPPQIQHNIH
jgi:hypothetical protein